MEMPKTGEKYRHRKGGEYEIVCLAKDRRSLDDIVVYRTLYENEVSEFWVRPLGEFCEIMEKDGVKIMRFEKIEE